MSRRNRVSEAVIRRLPKYYRYLKEMEKNGVQRISSRELSDKMGLTASKFVKILTVSADLDNRDMVIT